MTSFFGIAPLTLATWMAGAVGAAVLVLLVLAAFNRVLLKMALRNIPRRRAQTVLIVFGLMLATLITTASLAVGDTSAYSLQEIQVRQTGGIDEAFTRHPAEQYVQGASTATDGDFFTDAQTAEVIARSKSDPNVVAAVGVIAAAGSMVDETTGVPASENVAIFGVPADFASVWGPLRNGSGAVIDVAALSPDQVIIGKQLAVILNARPGDRIQLFVAGQPVEVTVKDILDTEVNPSIANHGPIVSSVVMPVAAVQQAIQHDGYNLILLHNSGSGGLDDLGTGGATGDEVTRRLSAVFEDQQAAQNLWNFMRAPAIVDQLESIHANASFLDPDRDLEARLIEELKRPAMTDEFKALAADRFADRIMADSVASSVPPAQSSAAEDELLARVRALQVDSGAAADLKAFLEQSDVAGPLAAAAATLPQGDGRRVAISGLLAEASKPALTPQLSAMAGDPALQALLLGVIRSVAPQQLARATGITSRLDLYTYSSYKADAVAFAQRGGLFASAALLGISFFSISVGVLLIFLIFVMLAAERRAEMGMSRAVGLKRRHLTQMFLFEGTAYTLAASAVGVILGLGVAALMIRVLSVVFSGFYKGIDLTFHVEWTSVVIAACLGILLTFIVVAFSAYRVSRLNIVAAIRDLDETDHRDDGLLRLFIAPFGVAWVALKQLRRGHPLVFLGRLTLGTLNAIRRFWWALFRRGPLTIAAGVGLVALSLWPDGGAYHVELVYSTGVSLFLIGAGLTIRWILTLAGARPPSASRAGFTFAALGLLLFWGQPFGRLEDLLGLGGRLQVKQLSGGPEVFVLSALMALLAAIWLVIYNSDLLIQGVMFLTGRVRSLAPVTRTSMAYPMSTKFRTGMAVAMFAIVTFVIAYMSVFSDVLIQNFGQADAESGHWQIVAGSPDFSFNATDRTQFPAGIAAMVQSDPATQRDIQAAGWENESGSTLHLVKPDGSVDNNPNNRGFGLHVVDDGYLSATGYALQARASGYASDRAAWDAVRDHAGYAIVDSSILDGANGAPAIVNFIQQTDRSFTPFQLQVGAGEHGGSFTPFRITVVGLMQRPIWDGVYLSTRTALASGDYFDPQATPNAGLGSTETPLVPTGYYFKVRPGVAINQARLDLARLLVKDELEPVIVSDQLAQQLSSILTLLNLITGFLALGLVVGIAGLGVITTRAVVERWQQIGMLRALGFRRSLVQRSFLMESSFVAILGLAIGAAIGLWESYRFFVVDKAFGTVDFHIPAAQIALILLGAYAATLLTTFLPSRAASRVAPAEALRYE